MWILNWSIDGGSCQRVITDSYNTVLTLISMLEKSIRPTLDYVVKRNLVIHVYTASGQEWDYEKNLAKTTVDAMESMAKEG